MKIIGYNNGIVKFYCKKCDFRGEYDINSLLTDNCVFKTSIVCDLCGNSRDLYVLKCKDQSESLRLNAEFQKLKINV
jgi:hypothetical protein